MKKKISLTSTPIRAVHRLVINTISKWGKSMLISNQLIMKARSLLVLVVLISLHGTALADESEIAFDIDAQELGAALNEFALQSNKEILFVEAETADKSATKVSGTYAPTAALDLLLADTGLEYRVNELDTVLVGAAAEQRGASDSKNLTPTPVLMAKNQASPKQATSSLNDAGGTSIVTGTVTDARTGANLKGAKVTIEETGQWTSTNDLGEFRFVNVPTGNTTLTVSYLGYAGQSAEIGVRGARASQNFALRGGSEIEEIVVFGTRSARALALNQERTAKNFTTVLASDFLGQFEANTISEAVRRAPGVAFTQSEASGDGTNIIIRGLGPDFNNVKLNGARLPEGTGLGRSPNLSNILTDSISKITISKTLLPSQDGSGTGGLVDIETKGPLDRPERFANFSIQGSQREGNFTDEFLVSGLLSGLFGENQNLGVSGGIQYREQDLETVSYNVFSDFGEYLPLNADGDAVTSERFLDPRLVGSFPFEAGVEQVYPRSLAINNNAVSNETLSVTAALQWAISDHTDMRLDYVRSEQELESYTSRFSLDSNQGYVPGPVDELGGEERGVLTWENGRFGPGAYMTVRQINDFSRRDIETDTLTFNVSSRHQTWTVDFAASYVNGSNETPINQSLDVARIEGFFVPIDIDLLTDEARQNTRNGNVISPFPQRTGNAFPRVLFNEAGFDFLNDSSSYVLSGGGDSPTAGENERFSASFDIRREFRSDFLRYIQIGAFFERARFEDDIFTNFSYSSNDATLESLGLRLTQNPLSEIGIESGFLTLSQDNFSNFLARIDQIAAQNPDVTITPSSGLRNLRDQAFTEEDNSAAYIEAQVDIGKLEIVGGLRLESVDVTARTVEFPRIRLADGTRDIETQDRLTMLIDQEGGQTELLPRLAMTYRHSDNLLLRASFFRTVARPQLRNLNKNRQISLDLRPRSGPNRDQPQIGVFEGNPDLDPSFTDSYDASIEYYFDDVGAIKFSLFYKTIDNLLENNSEQGIEVLDGVALPNDPLFETLPSNIFIVGSRPENSAFDAELWGAELAFDRQLTFLPGAWSGLGLYGNYTYTESEKSTVSGFFDPSFTFQEVRFDAPFTDDPEQSGTIAVTYNNNGIDAALSYTFQDRRMAAFNAYGLSAYFEEVDTLDLRAEYRFDRLGGTLRAFFEASDLLNGSKDTGVETSVGGDGLAPSVFRRANYFGGRKFTLGVSYTF